MKVNSGKLTHFDIETINQEYQKKEQGIEPDWEKIDSLIFPLKFFSKYLKNVRFSLIKNAKFAEYQPGNIVFREGDVGDLLYIILKGSVNVRNRMKNPEGKEEDLLVNCVYEGDSFGDIAMIVPNKSKELTGNALLMHHIESLAQKKTYHEIKAELVVADQSLDKKPNKINDQSNFGKIKENENAEGENNEQCQQAIHKRASTVEVAESLYCLSIPRENVQNVLVSMIQKELDQKVKVLMCLPFFEVRFIVL